VPWMTGHEANEAIPPAYTMYIGHQLATAHTFDPGRLAGQTDAPGDASTSRVPTRKLRFPV